METATNWRAHSSLARVPFIFRSFLVPHNFFFLLFLLLLSRCHPPSPPSFVISSFVFALRHLVLAYFPPSFRFQPVLFLFLSSNAASDFILFPAPPFSSATPLSPVAHYPYPNSFLRYAAPVYRVSLCFLVKLSVEI